MWCDSPLIRRSVDCKLQLLLQLLELLLSLVVIEELADGLMHIFRPVRNGCEMVSVIWDEQTALILAQVDDGCFRTRRYLRRMGRHSADRLLLPWKNRATNLLKFSKTFSHRIDVTLHPLQIGGVTLPANPRVPRKGCQGLSLRGV